MRNICFGGFGMIHKAHSLGRREDAVAESLNQYRQARQGLENSMKLSPSQSKFVSQHRQTYQTLAAKRAQQKNGIEGVPEQTEAERNFLGKKGRFNIMAALDKLESDTREVVKGLTEFESRQQPAAGHEPGKIAYHCEQMDKLARRWEIVGNQLQREADIDNAAPIVRRGGSRRIGHQSF